MSGDASVTRKQNVYEVKYKKIQLKDLQFVQGDNFFERGQFGDVKRAKWNDKVVAVKCFSSPDRKGGFSEELVCLSVLQKHDHIVEMYGACISDHPYIVLEFAPLSLEKVLHECKNEYRYTADNVIDWAYQMVTALDYIHGKEMLHRDIKPSNILLFKNGSVLKLCDFGTAKKLEHTLTNAVGTIRYMAPEVIRGRYYTDRCDVFSFAIVIWEMVTRKRPILNVKGQNTSSMAILYAMANGARPPMIRNLPRAIQEMITKCWDEEPQNRPPTSEIKRKLGILCEYVESGKPLISRRRPKPKETPPSQSDLFGADHKQGTQRESPHYRQQLEKQEREHSARENAGPDISHTPSPDPPRDRSATVPGPSRPTAITQKSGINKQPLGQASHMYQKQVSSPPTDTPSRQHPHHKRHDLHASFHNRPTYHQQAGIHQVSYVYGHQESEYEVGKFVAEEESSREQFVQGQQERYKQYEAVVLKGKDVVPGGLPIASLGSSPYAIQGIEPDLQPLIPNKDNPESMELYRQYKEVAEQVLRARKEYDELLDENAKLEREIYRDEQKLEENKGILQQFRARSNEKDTLMAKLQQLQQELNKLRIISVQLGQS